MSIQSSGDHKARLREYIKIEDLNDQIQDTMLSYLLTMHNLSEGTRARKGIASIKENASKAEIKDLTT